MNKYNSGDFLFSQLRDAVVLPSFQRRLVWSKGQKEAFIETLHNGYPFGSILIYKYNSERKNKYTLIDGLQRYTTILDFEDSPHKYMNFDEIVEELYTIIISEHYSADTITISAEKKLRSLINNCVIDLLRTKRQKTTYGLVDILNENTLLGFFQPLVNDRKINEIQEKINKKIKKYISIDELVIPYIEFTGDENELATVFENLNRGGKKLSKYQVFAAQWSYFNITLANTEHNKNILEKVITRYENLIETRDIDIENFDSDIMRENKVINLAELCGAIGEMILEVMPVFWDEKTKENEDKANVIGYSTIAITLNISNKKLNEISNEKELFNKKDFIEDFVEKILNEYKMINNYFGNYLQHPGISPNKKYENKLTPDFQILSFFAALWVEKYKFNTTKKRFEIIPRYKNNYETVKKNLIYYYIQELVQKRWSGTGDAKLDSVYIERSGRYLRTLERDELEELIGRWWDERSTVASINFDHLSRVLITIQSSFYRSQYKRESYDLEHIISRNSVAKTYKNNNLSAGSLGNIMFLSSDYNRSKKDINLYDSLKEGQTLEEHFLQDSLYPSQKDLNEIKVELSKKDTDFNKINDVISNRGKHIINNLLDNLYQ